MSTLTSEQAFARYEMFKEAADHLDQSVTDDEAEQNQIPYVQTLIRRNASKWLAFAQSTIKAAR